jgi:CcmD family protein
MNMRILTLTLLLAAPIGAALPSGVVRAAPGAVDGQPPPSKPSSTAAQDGFVPVDRPLSAQDTMPAPRLVAIAYGFIWVVVFGYVVSVRTRLSKVEREMETVARRLGSGGRPA